MTAFSANLGFLWTELDLPAAIRAAKRAGFAAVECHWPYQTPSEDVRAALRETGLPLVSLNTSRGALGQNGLAALPGETSRARAAIDEALAYADAVGAEAVHVMAGIAEGLDARAAFLANLAYAANRTTRTILIEPLNRLDAPGYFLTTTDQARRIAEDVGAPNLKIMFDCYHTQLMQGSLTRWIEYLLPLIGHIQIAGVPSRAEPDEGEVAYDRLMLAIAAMGYHGYIGAEYRPRGTVEEGLGWLEDFRAKMR